MRVFVTGGSGFVGSRLRARLAALGHPLVADEGEPDVTDRRAMDEVLQRGRPEAVVHLAARSSVAESLEEPLACFRVNFLGTHTLLEAVRAHTPDARVLLVGSGDQYGTRAPEAAPYRETDPLAPASPYAWSKAAAEGLGAAFAARGLDVVRVRAFNHTGAGQTDRFVASSFARQAAEIALAVRPPRMAVGNLASVRDFLDVEDVVDAYVALLERRVPAGVYNVASGVGCPIGEVLDRVLELAGVDPEVTIDPARVRPTDALVGDASRLRERTGWRPRRDLRETLAGLVEDWKRRVSDGSARSAAS